MKTGKQGHGVGVGTGRVEDDLAFLFCFRNAGTGLEAW